jgi:transcriptional regulator with AAA-type ATPase domain/tetratricopeptide (TPR) repeat protein
MQDLLGASPAIEALRANIGRLMGRARGSSRLPPVLIQGETGTGKGLVAGLLHRTGPRADGPFVAVNCAAIPEGLLESELFGFERGAFTDAKHAKPGLFQTAHRGVLFLDEVGLLPAALQAKLLNAIEEGSVRRLGSTRSERIDVWVISASNVDLRAAILEHRFREDLYQRLAGLTLSLPPLRERGDDVIMLAEHYLARASADFSLPPRTLTPEARARLLGYRWPGNVRELANLMERAALLSDTPQVTAATLDLKEAPLTAPPVPPPGSGAGAVSLDEAMRDHLQAVLDQTGGNITHTAAILGIARNTLRSRIRKLGLKGSGAVPPPSTPREGAPLAATGPATQTEVTPAPRTAAVRWERRLITILGAALSGPSETPSFQLAPALQDLITKARSFGARIEELTPDRVVAAFGFDPIEDGPRRASHSAVAMLKALERTEDRSTPRLAGRFAIHTGQYLIAQVSDVTGMDANDRRGAWSILDELVAQAEPDTIVVDGATARFLERRFELRPTGAGAGSAGQAYRVIGHERSGFEVGGRILSRFVGRERELATLHDLLARAEEGHGQIVGILGEPGVGKSRLLHEFQQGLERGRASYIEGRCLSYGNTMPYLPIIDIVRNSFGVLDTDAAEVITQKVHAGLERLEMEPEFTAPYLLHLLGCKGGVEAVVGLGPQAVKVRTMEALRQTAIAGSRERPIIFAVEDLQWIDQTGEEALASLAESLAGCPIMLIATYRPGYRPAWLERSYATQIGLNRLTRANSLAVLHSVVPEQELPPDLAQVILSHAEGVPFFLEELARAVTDHPDLRSDVMVPHTIQGVLVARIDRLPEEERHLLQTSSVIGKEVTIPVLKAVADLPEEVLRRCLARLEAAEFLHQTRVAPIEEYAFTHALTHEAAYQSVLEARRRPLHARVVEAIETLSPDIRERRPELLAWHYSHAELRGPAVACWQLAGQRAIQRSASAEAIAHLGKGLELLDEMPDTPERAPQELMLRMALGQAQVMSAGYGAPELEPTLARARELCQQMGESPHLFPVLFGLWRFYVARADIATAQELATQLLGAAERQGDQKLLTPAHVACGVPLFYRGELSAARAHLDQAVALYRPEYSTAQTLAYGQDLGVAALCFLAWTLGLLGYRDQAAETAERGLGLARAVSHPFTLALALHLNGMVRHLRGEMQVVGQIGEEELALAREQQFPFFLAGGLGFTGAALTASGKTEQGLELMREGARVYRATGQKLGLGHLAHLGGSLVGADRAEEALAIVAEALAWSPGSEERVYQAEFARIKGEALLRPATPDQEAATACFEEAIELARKQGARVFELRAVTSLARLWQQQGRAATAHDRLASAIGWFTEGLDLADQQAARSLLGELSASAAS